MREDIKNRLTGAVRQFRHNSDNSPDTHNPREGFVFGYDRGEVDELVGDLLGELEAARAQQSGEGREPVITNEMKAECMGEFEFTIEAECGECIDVGEDEDCEVCQGGIVYERKVTVPWTTCKEIYKRMTKCAPKAQGVPEVLAYFDKVISPVILAFALHSDELIVRRIWDEVRRAMLSTPPADKPEGEWVKPTGRKHHDLKTDPAVFRQSLNGVKPWEIRRNDRDFVRGDTVTLHETENTGAEMAEGAALIYTGRKISGVIGYVLGGPTYGIKDNWCVFTVIPAAPDMGGEK